MISVSRSRPREWLGIEIKVSEVPSTLFDTNANKKMLGAA